MRVSFAVVFVIFGGLSNPCHSIVIELFGISAKGEKVLLAEGDYALQEQNNGRPIYTGTEKYGFCDLAAGDVEGEFLVRCSRRVGASPFLVYKSDKDQAKTAYYREAKAIYKRNFPDDSRNDNYSQDFGGYYRCISGCNPAYAKILVKVLYRD